jgi:hypothetical protein
MSNIDNYILPFEDTITQLTNNKHIYSQTPLFFYMAIGSANIFDSYPEPENRHEYPEYIEKYPMKKILILIDPETGIPLHGSNYRFEQLINTNRRHRGYSYYINASEDTDIVEIHVIERNIYLIPSYYNNRDEQEYSEIFLYKLINLITSLNDKSLLMISSYTGTKLYQAQDYYINKFPIDRHQDIRKRFLIDSTYFTDVSCRYDLTNRLYQAIIIDGKFFNPGSLSPAEYNDKLINILNNENIDDRIIFHMKNIFFKLMHTIMDNEYMTYRSLYFESVDDDIKKYYHTIILEYIVRVLRMINMFIDVDTELEHFKTLNIYNYENQIKIVLSRILG